MFRFKYLIFIFILLSSLRLSYSQIPSQTPQLSFEEFIVEDGLASVNCILKDKEGFMWFGGTHGLYRYDGYKFKIFVHDLSNQHSLSNNSVICLFEDSHGYIWVGTMRGGLNKFNPVDESFENYYNTNFGIYSANYITAITEDADGLIWIGTFGEGAYKYNKKKNSYERFEHKALNSISSNDVFSIKADKNFIWITSNSGILDSYHKDSNTFNYFRFSDKKYKSARSGQRMTFDHSGNLWIATEEDGIFKFDIASKKFKHYEHLIGKPSISSNTISDVKEGKPGELWVTTYEGLNLINTNTGEISVFKNDVYDKFSITNNISYCLFIDSDYSLWMGMGDGTVNKTIHSPFKIYQPSFSKKSSSISFNVVVSLFLSDSILWIGTGGGGLDKLDLKTNTFHNYKHSPKNVNSIPSNIVMTIIEDNQGKVWTGNFRNGIIGYLDKKTNIFKQPDFKINKERNFANSLVFDLAEDDKDNIWIATYNEGLFKYSKRTKALFNFSPNNSTGLVSNKILRLLHDSTGKLWIGTLDKGIQIYEETGKRFKSLDEIGFENPSLASYPIKDIYEDNARNIWLATEGNGVYKLNLSDKQIDYFSTSNGLPSNSVYGIIQDNSNNFWFSTNRGIAMLNKTTKNITTYNANDGLPTNDFESGAIAKSKNGRLFFGSKKGLVAFYPSQLSVRIARPNLKFTTFKILNNNISVKEKIDNHIPLDSSILIKKVINLPYYLDNFSIEFAAPGHPSPHNIKYEYKLESLDDRWITTSSERPFANYSNVPPGDYKFKVKAIDENNNGTKNFSEKNIRLQIAPVWWQTRLAYLMYFVLMSSLFYYIYAGIRDRIRLKNKFLIEKYRHEKDEEVHQSKINFFTNISHELRTSLTLILTPLSELSKNEETSNKVNNLLMIINRNGQRLLNLLTQILDFRKIESDITKLKVSKVELPDFFEELCIPFHQYAKEKNIQFRLTVSNSCDKGWVDASKLEVITYNLLSNAFKFTKNKIDINVDLDEQDEKLIIKIKDNGKGIAKSELAKIFKNFYQVSPSKDDETAGTGIGLAITKNLVDAHKGEITVKSEELKYTIFNVLIPITKHFYVQDEIDAISSLVSIHSSSDYLVNKKNYGKGIDLMTKEAILPIILIVEDNLEIRNLIANNFSINYEVHTSTDGLEGCRKAFEIIPDVIISDIMMPKLNGLDLCKKIKTDERTAHIPVILLTARQSHAFKIEGFEYGADDYITKPFSFDTLNVRVNNLIASRKVLREKFKKEIILKPRDIAINNTDKIFIEKVLIIIEDNMSDSKFSVKLLSSEMGMSHSVLYRKIMALTGQNINDFIKSIKLSRASQLILQGNYTINEISDMTGFSDSKYFSTCFRKKFGLAPTQFKNRN